ncbi:hypothetical protein HELRODRAFT_125498, partial [Helobdella robusta]|uniref:Vitellogenin domain-containing protein n=1 Tax=Helobdella robusta TaxID=6412 RepID=T1EH62_HELRO
ECVQDVSVEHSIKVAALETFRRQKCHQPVMDFLEKITWSKEMDSELRIQAYLQRMRCADEKFLKGMLQDKLEKEQSQQVGSFIYSHLMNLANSDSPMKETLSRYLQDHDVVGNFEKFNLDFRKFSKNIDYSSFDDDKNFGGSVETNVIYSSKSFVPRSASVNL